MDNANRIQRRLQERSDIYSVVHVHHDAYVFHGRIKLHTYFCAALSKTTYSLEKMRKALYALDGFTPVTDYRVDGAHLQFGQAVREEVSEARIAELQHAGIHVRYAEHCDRITLRPLDHQLVVRLMPCYRLLSRHTTGNFVPPLDTGYHPVDLAIVKFLVR